MIDADRTADLLAALRFVVDYVVYHECQQFPSEPHETGTDYAQQEAELKCLGCGAEGVKRWSTGWKPEFTHEPGCRWLAFVETLRRENIDAPFEGR